MWGIIPAAGVGSRIQPLAFSKELLPVGSRHDGATERPCAVSEYILQRMIRGGAKKICFVIAPGKSDIMEYYGQADDGNGAVAISYTVQPQAVGLCDAIFRAVPLIPADEQVLIGLPDTIWFPEDGFNALPDDLFSFLMFPVEHPEFFDAVLTNQEGRILEIQVKSPEAQSSWVWGAFKMPGRVLHELHRLWVERGESDVYIGTLVNNYLARGGEVWGVRAGELYMDVGTLNGYREAIRILAKSPEVA